MGFSNGSDRPARLRRLAMWPGSVWRGAMLGVGIWRIRSAARREQRRTVCAARVRVPLFGAPAQPDASPGALPVSHLMAPPYRVSAWEAHVTDTGVTREVRRLVRALGRTPGEIALSLEAARVRTDGVRSPLEAYLTAVVGADARVKSVHVTDRRVEIVLHGWWRCPLTVALPPAAGAFASAFRAGCYPALSTTTPTTPTTTTAATTAATAATAAAREQIRPAID